MSAGEVNVVIAGVGGQGNILLSQIISLASIKHGLHVTVSETLGGAQRGGPVTSHIRLGSEAYSPSIPEGLANIVIGLEPIETLKAATKFLSNNGFVLMNKSPVYPNVVLLGQAEYPSIDKLVAIMKEISKDVFVVDATKLAVEAGNAVMTGVVMLGVLSAFGKLPFPSSVLIDAVKECVPPHAIDENLKSLQLGVEASRKLLHGAG